jgi:hypothetical protein
MFVTAITAVIVGTMAGLFVFVSTKAAQSLSKNGVLLQTQSLSEELENTLSQARSCQVVTVRAGVRGIRCTLPTLGTDVDSDGVMETYKGNWVGPTGQEGYGEGKRVWYYMSDGTGLPSAAVSRGGRLWRAWTTGNGLPTAGDVDAKFAFYYGNTSNPRWNFVDSVEFAANANGTITYTITTAKLFRAERVAAGSDASNTKTQLAVTRTVYCKNWRR